MANLQATTVTSGIISEKIGTTPADSEDDYTNILNQGFEVNQEVQYGPTPGIEWDDNEASRTIQYDPHNARRFVVIYSTTSNRFGCARIGIIKGTHGGPEEPSITYSNLYSFRNFGLTFEFVFAFDPSVPNKFVVTYKDTIPQYTSPSNPGSHLACVGTISALASDPTGFQITYGAVSNVGSNYNNKIHVSDIAFDPNRPGQFCITSTYWWGTIIDQGFIICGNVASSGTGTTLSWGTEMTYSNYGWSHKGSRIEYNPNVAGRVVVVWNHGHGLNHNFTTGTHGVCRALDVDVDGGNINRTGGTNDTVFYVGAIRHPCIAWNKLNTGKFAIVYQADDNGDRARILFGTCNSDGTFTAAGGDWAGASWTSAIKYPSIVFDPFYDQYFTSKGNLIISYQDDADSDKGKVRMNLIDWNSNSMSLGTAATFNNENTHGTMISADYKLPGRYIIGFAEAVTSPSGYIGKVIAGKINGGRATIDLSTGSFFTLDLQTCDFTIDQLVTTNVAAGVTTFDLRVIQGAPARYLDWGAINNTYSNERYLWTSEPSAISATDNAVDVYSFTTYDNGDTWYGSIVGQDIK